MYVAELQGKLSRKTERAEDVLTSNVFGFFKYADRRVYLKALLSAWGLQPTPEELDAAEFQFWPSYDEKTEPDLVLLIGDHYILVEAKYYNGFGQAGKDRDSQPKREIDGGQKEAHSLGKSFLYVVVTADYYYKPELFEEAVSLAGDAFHWTSWQRIASVIVTCLEGEGGPLADTGMAQDLLGLLARRHLRQFTSFELLETAAHAVTEPAAQLFFDAGTAAFRGDFIGFPETLDETTGVAPVAEDRLFFERG